MINLINLTQNSFFDIIDKALSSLERHYYIKESTRKKILDILQEEIKWDSKCEEMKK